MSSINKKQKPSKQKINLANSRRRAWRMWTNYLLSLLGWPVLVVAFFVLCELVCRSIFWQPSPVYDFLKFIEWNLPLFAILMAIVGWLGISFHFIHKSLQQVDVVAEAAKQLTKPTDTPIVLPPNLEDIAVELNIARERALHDARAAKDAEQRKNDLIVYLAHDLKTPLTSVIGYLTLLRDEPQLSVEMRARYTGIVLEKAERLEELINEFFDITRFNLSHIELEMQPVDLKRMLEQVVSEFEPIFDEAGLACKMTMPQAMPYVCDPDKLARVFDNLLRNASYYSLPNTTVEIQGVTNDDEMMLTFSNEGKHISQEKLDRIFEQFFRLDSARATQTGGAGLGLAIAKEIVEAHGGHIEAQCTENRITFILHLPLAREARL